MIWLAKTYILPCFIAITLLFNSCDPPCVPYLGYYLTDLAFIEEGTPNFNDAGLVNFSKMRMVRFNYCIIYAEHFQFING